MSLPDAVAALRGVYEAAGDIPTRIEAADWLACTLTFLDAADEAAEIVATTRAEIPRSWRISVGSSRQAS